MKIYIVNSKLISLNVLYFVSVFGFNDFGNGYRYLLKEMNATGAMFDSSATRMSWMEQPLDHFDDNENRTWKMRYFERHDMWKSGGPIYLFINGEGPAHSVFLNTGLLYDLAKETNGVMYLSEHRYYGKSMPLSNLTAETLVYLSARQALADNAKLLEHIKSNSTFNSSKIVVVGGSYAGNLAAWMKLMYPKLIDAAVASSAPVLAKLDFYEYLETVSHDFEEYGPPGCLDKIEETFQRYEDLFKSDRGIEQLKEEENICRDNDLRKDENRQLFFLDKASEFMVRAQYGSPDVIRKFCQSEIFTFFPGDDDSNLIWNERNECFDYDFDSMIESMKEIDWMLSWIYQTCTEFSYFQTTNSDNQPFTKNVPIEFYYKVCTKLFGPEFNGERVAQGVKETNELYKGLHPNLTHVVFVNGDMDPWSKLGILEDISYEAPVKIIARSSHCRDLFSDKSSDPEELKEARQYIKYLIKKWIGAGEYKKQ